jgi:hypothetical protein
MRGIGCSAFAVSLLAGACNSPALEQSESVDLSAAPLTISFNEGPVANCENVQGPLVPDTAGSDAITCYGGMQGRSPYGVSADREREPIILTTSATWSEINAPHQPLGPDGVWVDSNGLHVLAGGHELANPEVVGLTFQKTWDTVPLQPTFKTRIIGEEDDSRGRPMYLVEVSSDNGSNWHGLCPDGDYAYATKGVGWVGNQDSDEFSQRYATREFFACRRSAMAKAIRWGYSDDQHFGPATKMAIADYCADGLTHTFERTPIVFFDLEGLNAHAIQDPLDAATPTPSTESLPFFFEAAWHDKTGALCLSKLRWDSLPPGGFCNSRLPDPRLKGSTGKFCEDYAGPLASASDVFSALGAAHAKVFSASQFNERSLWVWKHDTDYITSALSWNQNDAAHVPAAGYQVDVSKYKQIAMVLAQPSPDGQSIPLNRYRNPQTNEIRTTTEPMSLRWSLVERVGWVYSSEQVLPSDVALVRLVRWSNAAGTRSVLLRDGQVPPASYNHAHDEGWALPPVNP